MSRVEQLPDSEDKDILLNNLEYVSYPYLISLSGYNHVLELAGKEPLALSDDEAAVFKSLEFTSDSMNQNIMIFWQTARRWHIWIIRCI